MKKGMQDKETRERVSLNLQTYTFLVFCKILKKVNVL